MARRTQFLAQPEAVPADLVVEPEVLVEFLSSLLLIIGMDVQAQLIVKGLVVIGAVALYSLAERRP